MVRHLILATAAAALLATPATARHRWRHHWRSYSYYSPFGYGYSPFGYSYGYRSYGYSPYGYSRYGYSGYPTYGYYNRSRDYYGYYGDRRWRHRDRDDDQGEDNDD